MLRVRTPLSVDTASSGKELTKKLTIIFVFCIRHLGGGVCPPPHFAAASGLHTKWKSGRMEAHRECKNLTTTFRFDLFLPPPRGRQQDEKQWEVYKKKTLHSIFVCSPPPRSGKTTKVGSTAPLSFFCAHSVLEKSKNKMRIYVPTPFFISQRHKYFNRTE